VEAEISPEPSPSERAALGEALDRFLEPAARPVVALYGSAWRLAGLRENAGEARVD